ncbi:unnamed protein product [Sphagnum balticum]
MEDELVTESHGPSGFMYAAIFDGHAGFSSAQFLRHEVYKECVTALEGGALLESQDLSEAETAVTCAFLQADKRLLFMCASSVETVAVGNGNYRLEETQTGAEKESGSTATIMFVRSDWLLLAHVGDSCVVLSNGKSCGYLFRSLTTWELQILYSRVCGSLSVSCAFGDVPFKSRKKSMMEEGIKDRRWTEAFASMKKLDGEWLVALPDTSHIDVNEDMEFIILASDGLWDSFKNADAVQFVQKKLKKHADAQMWNGQDNVSVIVADFGYRTIHPLFLPQISQVLT